MKAARTLPSILSAIAIVLIAWSLLAPWAAAFPGGADHYKVSLFGIRHVFGMEADAPQVRCRWGTAAEPCRPAADGGSSYAALAGARWLVLLSLGLLVAVNLIRLRRADGTAAVLAAAALSAACGILLVRLNVASALAIVSGTQLRFSRSGLTAAGFGATLCAAAAMMSAYPRGPAPSLPKLSGPAAP
jgi:hypothetical protein